MSIISKLVQWFDGLKIFISNNKKLSIIIMSLVGLLIIVIAVLLFVMITKKDGPVDNSKPLSDSLSDIQSGRLVLISKPGNTASLNENITIQVVADSTAQDINAFDIVVKFDPELVSFVSEKKLVDGFDYVRRLRKGLVYINGVKELENSESSVFSNSPIFVLEFKPLKPGIAGFDILHAPRSTSQSGLWNVQSQNVISTVVGLKIDIK